MNLYDLTKGNYHMVRTITYPDFPESKIVTKAKVKANKKSEWKTDISINGTYNGPTDVVSVKDYKVMWMQQGKEIAETGSATLVLSSGKSVRQLWTSTITPKHHFKKFPREGEQIEISISAFEIKDKSMSYQWDGTVKTRKY